MRSGARRIMRITQIGMVVNVALMAIKLIVGALVGSIGLVADGIHSLFDLITDIVVIVSTRIGSRPPDKDHPWGHGKMETMGALIISVIFCVAGVEISRKAIESFSRGEYHYPGVIALLVATFSFFTKEWLFHISKKVARETGSRTLLANAWHHRSDALSSLAVMAGVGATFIGFDQGDNVAGLFVGLMILVAGFRFIFDAASELVEQSADPETLRKLESSLATIEDVSAWHRIRSRHVGRALFIDLHVSVPRNFTVVEADRVAHEVEDVINRSLSMPSNVIVHVDPESDPEGGDR